MTYHKYLLLIFVVAATSCGVTVKTTITKSYPPLSDTERVTVVPENQLAPSNTSLVGTVAVYDPGSPMICGYDYVVKKATLEARKAGGNVLKITKHVKPALNTCHNIWADILKIDTSASTD